MPDLVNPEQEETSAAVDAGIDQAEAFANDPANASPGFASRLAAGATGAGRFVGRHKKSFGGGTVAAILALFVLGFVAYGPLKLEHIFQNLFHHNFGAQENWEKKEGHAVMDRLFKYRLNPDNSTKSGYGLRAKFNDFQIDRFKTQMAKKGWTLEFKEGQLTGITGPDGTFNDLSEAGIFEKRGALATVVDDTVPHWRIGKILKYRRLMASHARVSFKLFAVDKAKSTIKDLYEKLRQKVQNGAPESEVEATVGDQQPTDKTTPPDSNPVEHEATASSLKDVINGARDAFNSGAGTAGAIKAGLQIFKTKMITRSLLITGTVTMLCATEKEVKKAADQTEIQRADQLIRHGNLLMTADSQMHDGTGLTGDQFGEFMTLFDGDTSANVEVSDKGQTTNIAKENTLSFDQSAEWKRATNQPVDTEANPDLSSAANPNPAGAQVIIDKIDSVLQKTGGGALCGALTSKAGFFIQLGVGIAQIVVDIGSLGGAQAAILAGNVTAQFAFMRYALPQIIGLFTHIAITGSEDAVQWLNNTGAGMSLASLDYGRSIGAAPVSNSQYAYLQQEADKADAQDLHNQPVFKQLFALTDSRSFLSQLLDRLPSPKTALASFSAGFSHLPSFIFGNLFATQLAVAGDTANSVNPYSFNLNGFTDSEIGKYDPLSNEDWLNGTVKLPVGYDDQNIEVKRMDVLGDPNNFQDSADPNSDTNTQDLLHCFVNKYVSWNYRQNNQQSADDGSGIGVSTDPLTQIQTCGTIGVIEQVNYQAPDLQSMFCHYQGDHTQYTNPPKGHKANPCNPDISDALGHFRQYLLDLHIAGNITSWSDDQ